MPYGVYIRTKPAWNKGLTKEADSRVLKQSITQTGLKLTEEHRHKLRLAKLGKKQTLEHRKKVGDALRGKKKSPFSEEHIKNMSLSHKGIKMPPKTLEHRRKLSESQRGEKSHLWRGGLSDINDRIRHSVETKIARKACFERDNYTCIWCGIKGGIWLKEKKKKVILNADHIKPFCDYPELRFELNNLRTLCEDCHRKTDTWGRNALKVKEQEYKI